MTSTAHRGLEPLSTQIVGSYVKPHWLARHEKMGTFDGSWWRPDAAVLDEARRDAALLSICEQERAGLDLVTDGEAFRAAYDRHFIAALDGIDVELLDDRSLPDETGAIRRDETGLDEFVAHARMRPRIVSPLSWRGPATEAEARFLKAQARRPTKMTIVGAFTLYTRLSDRFYADPAEAVLALARALNHELRAMDQAGIDVLQIDEPSFHLHHARAATIGAEAIRTMIEGIEAPVLVHVCYGYALVNRDKSWSGLYPKVLDILAGLPIAGISLEYEQPRHQPELLAHCGDKHVVLGLLDLAAPQVEAPDHVARRIEAASRIVPAERLHPASDCGMWYLPRERARAKLEALVAGRDRFRGAQA